MITKQYTVNAIRLIKFTFTRLVKLVYYYHGTINCKDCRIENIR